MTIKKCILIALALLTQASASADNTRGPYITGPENTFNYVAQGVMGVGTSANLYQGPLKLEAIRISHSQPTRALLVIDRTGLITVPSHPDRPATDKEIADAFREWQMGNIWSAK